MLVWGQPGQNKRPAGTDLSFDKEWKLRQYYEVGTLYPFTVGLCTSDQKVGGTQQTRYTVLDLRGEKHTLYCDCTRYKYNQTIYLKVREISNGELKFESDIKERLDEIFETEEEYEFEVINYQAGRYVVCDRIIGMNHYLSSDDSELYPTRQILKLEVQGFDDTGRMLLLDRNPPKPTGPIINELQVLAENQAKEQKSQSPQVGKHQQPPDSVRKRRRNRQYSNDPPKVAASIAIPRESNRRLVPDFGYSLPGKETGAKRGAEPEPVYTRSEKTPQAGGKQCKGVKGDLSGVSEKGDSAAPRREKKNPVKDIAQETEQRETLGTEKEPKVEESVSAPLTEPVPGVEAFPESESTQHTPTGELPQEMPLNDAAEVTSWEELVAKQEAPTGDRKELMEAVHTGETEQTELSLAEEDSGNEVSEEEALMEPQPELRTDEAEAESYSDVEERSEQAPIPQKDAIFYPFIAWMDDVYGMEKPVVFTVKSGQADEGDAVELPEYQRQDVELPEQEVPEQEVVQMETMPWYVRKWHWIKSLLFKKR